MKRLASELIRRMPELTIKRISDLALENAEMNQPYIGKTVLDLAKESAAEASQSAIVISAGPSLHRNESVKRIKGSGYDGTIICVDGSLSVCLRNGLIPDYVVTLDPNRTRPVRWFGDVELTSIPEDDYYRRQDLDPYLGVAELERNQELIELVNKHGPSIKAIISTSASQPVTKRCIESGMELYWWNPIYDDFDSPNSVTRRVYQANKVPCLANGGNVGTSAWVVAHAVLGRSDVAMVGMDFSYAPDTPLLNTQYYKEIEEMFGDKTADAFIYVDNPYTNETWFTDPAYYWYNQSFLQLAKEAECNTLNCTEGGILFGEGIEFVPLRQFLSSQTGSN